MGTAAKPIRGRTMADERETEDGGSGKRNGGDRQKALVDGANVAHASEGDSARLRNILLICEKLEGEGYEPIIVVDASLRHRIDERGEYERLVDAGEIRQAPAGTDADYFILSFARELDASIVSNDRFRDRMEAFPDARERIIRYMILKDEVVLERRNKRR
jgi:hypothetical protein